MQQPIGFRDPDGRQMLARLALCSTLLPFPVTHLPAQSQTSPAFGSAPTSAATSDSSAATSDDAIPLNDYLGLLRQVDPSAEEAARTYLAAIRLRCGWTPGVDALRRAMAREGGDPVLMGLMRAAQDRDTAERRRLVDQVPCAAGGSR